jgi:hypothetical protein
MRWLIGLVLVVTLGGCGVPLQQAAQPIPADAIPSPLPLPLPTPTATPDTPGGSIEPSPEPVSESVRVWFVREDGLVGVETTVAIPVTAESVVQELALGPSPENIVEGLRTVSRDPLSGRSLVRVVNEPVVDVIGRVIVTVSLSSAFAALPPTEQVLLLGQVVLSLTGLDIDAVEFVDDVGSPVAVPLPDGRLLDIPAIARDYAGLIVEL